MRTPRKQRSTLRANRPTKRERVRLHDQDDNESYPRWRDFIDVTPALELMPRHTAEEHATFVADIREKNVVQSIVLAKMGNRAVLVDGLKRLNASDEAGRPPVDRDGTILIPHTWLEDGLDPEEEAIRLNVGLRKALNQKERRRLIEDVLRLHSQWANNRIGEAIGVSDKTVNAARERLVAASEIPNLTETIGRDGKKYPQRQRRIDRMVQKTAQCHWCGHEYDINQLSHAARLSKAFICPGCAANAIFKATPTTLALGGRRLKAVVIPAPVLPRTTDYPAELRDLNPTTDADNDALVMVSESDEPLWQLLVRYNAAEDAIAKMREVKLKRGSRLAPLISEAEDALDQLRRCLTIEAETNRERLVADSEFPNLTETAEAVA